MIIWTNKAKTDRYDFLDRDWRAFSWQEGKGWQDAVAGLGQVRPVIAEVHAYLREKRGDTVVSHRGLGIERLEWSPRLERFQVAESTDSCPYQATVRQVLYALSPREVQLAYQQGRELTAAELEAATVAGKPAPTASSAARARALAFGFSAVDLPANPGRTVFANSNNTARYDLVDGVWQTRLLLRGFARNAWVDAPLEPDISFELGNRHGCRFEDRYKLKDELSQAVRAGRGDLVQLHPYANHYLVWSGNSYLYGRMSGFAEYGEFGARTDCLLFLIASDEILREYYESKCLH